MVLLNGVKYACDRCIRGHRVSSCTHTDKPLTMIKPKGRPSSQCSHCREQRKIKNSHSSCSCGKKGKPPGTHLPSWLCHNNSHCMCSGEDKKPVVKRKTDVTPPTSAEPVSSAASIAENPPTNGNAPSGSSLSHFNSHLSTPPMGNFAPMIMENNYLCKDLPVLYESTQDLLDFIIEQDVNGHSRAPVSEVPSLHDDAHGNWSLDSLSPLHEVGMNGVAFPEMGIAGLSLSNAELKAMENMFSLFPLVGSGSFENEHLQLLPPPDSGVEFGLHEPKEASSGKSRVSRAQLLNSALGASYLAPEHQYPGVHSPTMHNHSNHTYAHAQTQETSVDGTAAQKLTAHVQSPSLGSPGVALLQHLHHNLTSSSSFHNGFPAGYPAANMPQVYPIRGSSSFTLGSSTANLRRPESIFSLGSASSDTSKQNLLETSQMTQHAFPKASSFAAFPPLLLSGNNSIDDFHFPSHNTLAPAFNDAQLVTNLRGEEKTNSASFCAGHAPPISLEPMLLLRGALPLFRSYSHLHNPSVKEHSP